MRIEDRLYVGRIVAFNLGTGCGRIQIPGWDRSIYFSKECLVETTTLQDLHLLEKTEKGFPRVYVAFMIGWEEEQFSAFKIPGQERQGKRDPAPRAVNIQILHTLLSQCKKDSHGDPL